VQECPGRHDRGPRLVGYRQWRQNRQSGRAHRGLAGRRLFFTGGLRGLSLPAVARLPRDHHPAGAARGQAFRLGDFRDSQPGPGAGDDRRHGAGRHE